MKEEGSALDASTIGVREQKERANNKRDSGQSVEFRTEIMERLKIMK